MTNIVEFGRRDKSAEDADVAQAPSIPEPVTPKQWILEYKLPDSTCGYYTNYGVIKMNGPFIVIVENDNQPTNTDDALFLVPYEHLISIRRVDEQVPQQV